MTKESFDLFVGALQSAGIDKYSFRFNGGNKIGDHNTETSRAIPEADHIILVETNINYAQMGKPFLVSCVEYDNLDSVFASNLSVEETIKLLNELGTVDKDMTAFISRRGSRSNLVPGTAGISVMHDKEGNTVIGEHSPGYVTK